MYPTDYNHPLFTAANTSELQQYLRAMQEDCEPDESNQSFRILQRLQKLARAGKGLRLHTKYGLGSWTRPSGDEKLFAIRFDGDDSSTNVSFSAIKTFWFEVE